MDLTGIILRRRSTRKYSDEPISDDALRYVVQAVLLAPTSRNRRPCELVVVRDKAVLKQLSRAKKMGAGHIANGDAAIVVLADSGKADTWVEDSSVALSLMMLAATEQGIGNCWVQMHLRTSLTGKDAEKNVRDALGISDDAIRVVGVLALGMPDQELAARSVEDADWSRVRWLG